MTVNSMKGRASGAGSRGWGRRAVGIIKRRLSAGALLRRPRGHLRTVWAARNATVAAIVLAVVGAWPMTLEAESLEGHVLDPQGAAVGNADLRLVKRTGGISRSAKSTAAGEYRFPNLSEGEYLLEGVAADSALAGSALVSVRGPTPFDIELAVVPSQTEILVTSTGTPLERPEVARALSAFGAEDVAARAEFSLGDALRAVPGIRVRQLRGPGSFTSVQTRGLRNQDTSLLIDGMRFRDPGSTQGDASAFYQDIAIVDADRVEVLRGTASSIYGSHAMGGVINISSRQGGGRPHGEIRAEGGGLGMLRGVARGGGGLAADRFRYSGGLSHVNVTRGHRGQSPFRNSSAQGSATFSLRPGLVLSGRAWVSDSFRMLVESPAFPPAVVANFPASGRVTAKALPEAQLGLLERGQPYDAGSATFVPDQIDPDQRNSSNFQTVSVALQHQFSQEGSWRVSYLSVKTGRRYRDGPAGPSPFDPLISNDSRYDGSTQLLVARADKRLAGSHQVSAGYELEREAYSNFNTDESPSPASNLTRIDQSSHAAYGQGQLRALDERLHLSFSGRMQGFQLGTPEFADVAGPYAGASADSPALALTGDAAIAFFGRSTGTKLRGHVGNGFRAPSLFERFGGTYSPWTAGFDFWGDPKIAPERSLAADFGIDQWLLASALRLSGTFFYTDLAETIIFDFANFPPDDAYGRFGGYRNFGGGISRGVEVSAQMAASAGTSVRLAYTYANAESRSPTIGAGFFEIQGHSNHLWTATTSHWLTPRVSVTFDLFAASDYILSPYGAQSRLLSFGGPVKADLVLRYEMPFSDGRRVELYGKLENIFNNDYFENGFASPGAWGIGGVRYRF